MSSVIEVKYKVASTNYSIRKVLSALKDYDTLGFDTETKGVYSKQERKDAVQFLKNEDIDPDNKRQALLVSGNSGLSFPALVNVTHFIFGISKSESVVVICSDHKTEMMVWKWVAEFKGLFLVHNALFDFKIMYHRVGKFPKNYIDTSLEAKCLINHVNIWKSKTGLKEIMGSYYKPRWSELEEYEPDNSHDPVFVEYASIDGAAVVYLWELIQEMKDETD